MLPKEKLENFIIYKTMEFLNDDKTIERLSKMLYDLQHQESTFLPRLLQQVKDKDKEIDNIVNAIQKGVSSEALLKRLTKLEEEKSEINVAIAKE